MSANLRELDRTTAEYRKACQKLVLELFPDAQTAGPVDFLEKAREVRARIQSRIYVQNQIKGK